MSLALSLVHSRGLAMDSSGDVSLAIRRARRAGSKILDLSHRGLSEWPDGLFGLRHLESLDVSGNSLTFLDSGLKELQQLEELNVSDNRVDKLPEWDISLLQSLRRLHLGGNPLASGMSPASIRQLAQPPEARGKTPSEMISTLLMEGSSGGGGSSASLGRLISRGGSSAAVDEVEEFLEDFNSRGGTRGGGWDDDDIRPAAQSNMGPPSGNAADSRPAWLRNDAKTERLSSTLPSRQLKAADSNEASELRNQLQEEQRRCKRLEQQLQKLSARLGEQDMRAGGIGSVPHFDFADVQLGDVMAQGGFSVVHRGVWHSTPIALKKLFDPKINEELLAEFDNEVQKLEQIRHPNILLLLAVHRRPPSLSMITELVEGGSFFQYLHQPSKFNMHSGPLEGASYGQSLRIMELSGAALAYVHARGIAHRDVKSQNVLLSPTLDVKLCDFGLARMRSELMTGAMQYAGTPNYMAPELFQNQKYTENVDVWAYGIMLWEAMSVDIPFANLDPPEIRSRVCAGRMLEMSSTLPLQVQRLIQACWTIDRASRPSMQEVMVHIGKCPKGKLQDESDGDGDEDDAVQPLRSFRPHTAPPGCGEDSLTTFSTSRAVPSRMAPTRGF